MKISQTKVVNVDAKQIRIHIKVCDRFQASIHDESGAEIGGQEDGYVPDFMPGQHYGDYLILDVDLDSGQITNWKAPNAGQIEAFIRGDNDE